GVRQITWDDLVPPAAPLVDPFEKLEMNDKVELGFIYDIARQLELGYIDKTDGNIPYAMELRAKLTAKGLDVTALLAQDRAFRTEIQARGRQVVGALNGQVVQMPGYALPLEFTEKAINKFLLVPYVGACIHSPPPPPNQLIVVTLEKPYKVSDIYDPIWITGRLSAKAATEQLDFIDGQTDVESGYAMTGMEIAPYEDPDDKKK
ncbi:MAG: DUF3299 domain-containing protein, partial [Rhodospirillaceae bacterium]